MRKLLTFLGSSTTILLLIMIALSRFFSFNAEYPMLTLEKGWTVTYQNQQFINTNLEELNRQVGSSFNRGESITLSYAKPLPRLDCPFPYLFFKTQFCAYEIFIDDELISSKYVNYIDNNDFIGLGYDAVPLPKECFGKKLKIKLYVTENNTKADIINPIVGNFDDLYRYFYHKVIFPLFIGIFLIVFGQVFLIISGILYFKTSGVLTQVICSIINILLGIWVLTIYDVTNFIISKPLGTLAEYMSIYLLIPMLYALIHNLHKKQNNKVLIFTGYGTLFFSISFIALHMINLVHINHFQIPFYLLSFVGIMVLVLYIYMDIKNKVRSSSVQILMLGLSVLALALTIYAIIGITLPIVDYRQLPIMIYLLPGGSVFFVVAQLLNYFIFMTHSFAQKQEYASLKQVAYEDNLTGLPNRVSCDKELAKLNESEEEFCLLSLDLNGLKEVNDNSGHPAGDRLLKSFAETLSDVFSEKGMCCRIGGDEFLVLLKDIPSDELDHMLKILDLRLKELDKKDPEANHSVSYGYAYRSETKEHDTHSVFMLADKRMYEYKRKYYSNMMKR